MIKNCGSSSTIYISAQFIIILRDIKALKINVDDFNRSFVYDPKCDNSPACTVKTPTRTYTDCKCVCTVRCNAADNFVTLRDRCQCSVLEGFSRLIDAKAEIQKVFAEQSYNFNDAESVSTLLKELNVELINANTAIGNYENKWDTTTMEQKHFVLEATIAKIRSAIEKSKKNIVSGVCPTQCTRPQVIRVSDCTCYTTTPITDFFKKFPIFAATETKIRSFDFKLDIETQKSFYEWALRIRKEASEFYKKATEHVFDVSSQTLLYDEFVKHIDELNEVWKTYSNSMIVTTTKCSVVCTGDTVKNCAKCSCIPAKGWTELNTVVLNRVNGYLEEIELLDINIADETTLTKNANKIKTGINELKAHFIDYCGNLDESHIALRIFEILGWTNKLKSDIEAAKLPQFVQVCASTCPTSLWAYNALACKCTCEIKECVVGAQIFDPYNCLCAKISTCALTSSSCTGLSPVLDYSSCLCKKKPTH